jgi:hypothetical protein
MRRPRLQFQLSTLLWLTLAVACWFGGMRVERERIKQAARMSDQELAERYGVDLNTWDKYTVAERRWIKARPPGKWRAIPASEYRDLRE